MNKLPVAKNVEEYILQFPEMVQASLRQLRKTVLTIAPQAEEKISYQMPGYKYHGMLVYFAAYKNHIGFYPSTTPLLAFKKELAVYKSAKGSVQFPMDKPLPLALIRKIVKFKLKENLQKEKFRVNAKKDKPYMKKAKT